MKLICIDNSGEQLCYLTKGKIYYCEEDGDGYWSVTNDDGDENWSAFKWRFRNIDINKNIKIL